MPNNYSFVIPNLLAGMAYPGITRPIEAELQALKQDGITAVVTLTESSLPKKILEEHGFNYLHLPIVDFTPPTLDQIEKFTSFVSMNHKENKGVAVHCAAGIGRTGTMLACYLVYIGETPEQAIDSIRSIRPGSIETTEQEDIIYMYYKEAAYNG